MYAIIQWMDNDNYVVPILNDEGSLKLFDKIEEADEYASQIEPNDSVRVISIEGVREQGGEIKMEITKGTISLFVKKLVEDKIVRIVIGNQYFEKALRDSYEDFLIND